MKYETTVEEMIKGEKVMNRIAKWQQVLMVMFGIIIMLTLGYREGYAKCDANGCDTWEEQVKAWEKDL